MPSTYSQSYYDAVSDTRSADALRRLADLPGEVGRLVRKLAEYNRHKRDEARSDALHILVLGPLITVDDLPCFGNAPEAWRALYEPYRAALSDVEACDAAFLSLWRRTAGKLLSDAADDEEARRLVARIEAQRDAVTRPIGDLQRLRVQLLPDALSSWLAAIEADDAKLPGLAKRAEASRRKAEEDSNALAVVQRHRDLARDQMQAIGQTMLSLMEHAEKHEELRKLLNIQPPAPIGKVLYPRPGPDGHTAPLPAPEEAGPLEHTESPW